MTKIPKFKSIDEELDFWSKHSTLEFMDMGEEVQLDFSAARKERELRRAKALSRGRMEAMMPVCQGTASAARGSLTVLPKTPSVTVILPPPSVHCVIGVQTERGYRYYAS